MATKRIGGHKGPQVATPSTTKYYQAPAELTAEERAMLAIPFDQQEFRRLVELGKERGWIRLPCTLTAEELGDS